MIGVAAAFAVAAEARKSERKSGQRDILASAIRALRATRPTAVNLFAALDLMQNTLDEAKDHIAMRLEQTAYSIFNADRESCDKIAEFGVDIVPKNARIVTICNTGYLATAGVGTALGVISRAFDEGKIREVFALETRPLLQGARLTAWELLQSQIPVTLLADGAAGSLLRRGGIDLAIIGADRIVANGDTANKIGSLQLALACSRFNVPFFVAAPFTTFDPATRTAAEIVVEERSAEEVTHFKGKAVAAEGVSVYNPAFDLVEAGLITGFITDRGIFKPPYQFN